jgi:hypothetical protein
MKPLLVGLLLDVSSSMAKPMHKGDAATRLHRLQEAVDDLVARARAIVDESPERIDGLFHVFAFGFGFGNLRTLAFGRNVPAVRNLLTLGEDNDDVIEGAVLLRDWERYRENIGRLTLDMLGTTPMVEAFGRVERLLDNLESRRFYRDQPVLLVVSDGTPTDPPDTGPQLVRSAAERIRDRGTAIVSCFVGSQDTRFAKTLYAKPQAEWPPGARLMFDCASPVTSHPAFYSHLTEYEWEVPEGARLFTQVNQVDSFAEFSQVLFSPLEAANVEPPSSAAHTRVPISVMVSYSHTDAAYVSDNRGSLLSYIRGLERENVTFWCDRSLRAGDLWNSEIEARLQTADIALILVSQAFLNSSYCTKEARTFIERRRASGLRIIPVILSACDWSSQPWLAETQVLPSGGRNVEEHYKLPGKRKALFLEILKELHASVAAIAGQRANS